MSKPWKTVVVAWLAASALAVAQAPPASSTLPPGPATTPAAPAKPADPPPKPAIPELPTFVPALPCAVPEQPCPTPSPILSGILMPPCLPPVAWIRAEGLLWWIRDQPDPQALLRTSGLNSPFGFTGQSTALNDPIAQTIIGQNNIAMGSFGGGRVTAGFWFDYDRSVGVEANGFFLTQNSTTLMPAPTRTRACRSWAGPTTTPPQARRPPSRYPASLPWPAT